MDADTIDRVTGLSTAAGFRSALRTRAGASRGLAGVGLVLLDLDDFHQVNASSGFTAGDDLLHGVATGLRAAVGVGMGAPQVAPQVARLSADEFAVLVDADADELPDLAERLHRAVTHAASGTTACVGHAAGTSAGTVQDLMSRAGAALRAARLRGPRSSAGGSDVVLATSLAEQEDLEVRTALRLGEYELHYLPIVRLVDRRTVGVETLVRWRRGHGALEAPGSFLPFVRRSGLAAEFGAHVLEQAARQWVAGLRAAVKVVAPAEDAAPRLSVNIHGEQAEQEGFDALVLHLLHRCGVATDEFMLEVTEGALDHPSVPDRLARLRAAGVRISLDDFGSGPIVLARRGELPIDVIKIDQTLIRELDVEDPDIELVADVLRLASLLGLEVAVEGVETPVLAERLHRIGVPLAQGFLFGRPCTAEELVARLVTEQAVSR